MCNTCNAHAIVTIFNIWTYLRDFARFFPAKFGNLHFWRSAKIAWPSIVRVDCRVWSPICGDVPCCDTALGAASQWGDHHIGRFSFLLLRWAAQGQLGTGLHSLMGGWNGTWLVPDFGMICSGNRMRSIMLCILWILHDFGDITWYNSFLGHGLINMDRHYSWTLGGEWDPHPILAPIMH